MNVIFICQNDWANECYTISKALRKVGVNSKTFIKHKHSFGYPEQGIHYRNIKMIQGDIRLADVVVFGFSKYCQTGVDLSGKVISVLHGGSDYRQFYKRINKIFNPIVDLTLTGSDMLNLGAKNEVCVFSAVDTDILKPCYSNFNQKRRIVGHYPSGEKGTGIIQHVIQKLQQELDFEFKYSNQKVPFLTQIDRMSKCDIYIENMQPHQLNVPLTTFGRTCLESAALGKVVCTRFPDILLYEQMFGKCAIQVTNTAEELESKLRYLLSCTNEKISSLQKDTRKWVEDYHSLEAMGTKWKNIFVEALIIKRKQNK